MSPPGRKGADGLADADVPRVLPAIKRPLISCPVVHCEHGLPPQRAQHPLVGLEDCKEGLRVALLSCSGLQFLTSWNRL